MRVRMGKKDYGKPEIDMLFLWNCLVFEEATWNLEKDELATHELFNVIWRSQQNFKSKKQTNKKTDFKKKNDSFESQEMAAKLNRTFFFFFFLTNTVLYLKFNFTSSNYLFALKPFLNLWWHPICLRVWCKNDGEFRYG